MVHTGHTESQEVSHWMSIGLLFKNNFWGRNPETSGVLTKRSSLHNINELSNEKNLGWLGYIWDYTTQLYRDYNKPL